ncbi:hypothetical protein DPMN_000227 [Dreissena polymorpha]|uniref:Uncharacterized protein n=1 Tax=Dreissena polymorpha TaxID=45954 RepID=A0A9D4MJC0_DREPO|nr:hypothetical protein DPMN_000227 [Dreissena polymorpha]
MRNKHISRSAAARRNESAVEATSVCGGKLHFDAKLRICPPTHAEASRYLRHAAESMRIFKSKSF